MSKNLKYTASFWTFLGANFLQNCSFQASPFAVRVHGVRGGHVCGPQLQVPILQNSVSAKKFLGQTFIIL
jgi:hypothetical protein